jgi:hypothetical protein
MAASTRGDEDKVGVPPSPLLRDGCKKTNQRKENETDSYVSQRQDINRTVVHMRRKHMACRRHA